MNLRISTLFALALLLVSAAASSARNGHDGPDKPPAAPKQLEYLQGVVFVKLNRNVPNRRDAVTFGITSLDNVMRKIGAFERNPALPLAPYPVFEPLSIIGGGVTDYGFERLYIVRYNTMYDAKEVSRMLVETGVLDYAEPHYIFPLLYTPNDPMLAQQTWLNIIKAQQAWDINKGDSAIVIGVCDTGVEWTHEDLAQNIVSRDGETGTDGQGKDKRSNGIDDDGNGFVDDWHGWDFVGNPTTLAELQSGQFQPDNDPSPRPNNTAGYEGYHGTWVSGCASARADNGKGVAGPGFQCKILPIKCASDSLYTNSVVSGYQGIRYGVDAGANIVNCSWGGSGVTNIQALQDFINYAYSNNVLVIASSGNEGMNVDATPTYPGNLNHVLSVGATTAQDSAASFSNYGTSVSIWAPGVSTLTTNVNNSYTSSNVSGTSFSSPITAGVAALVMSAHNTWTPDQVAMQLRVTGDRVKVRYPQYGPLFYRRVNAYNALNINRSFTSGTTYPGLKLVSYKLNGKALDTLSGSKPTIDVELTMINYLAPSNNLTITAETGQALTTVAPSYSVPSVGTMAQTTQTIQVVVNPAAQVLYSEGSIPLLLKLTDGAYEDLITVPIPVNLPGWHKRFDPASGSTTVYVASSINAASVDVGWAAANTSGNIPVFSMTTNGGGSWTTYRPVTSSAEPIYCIAATNNTNAWAGSGPTSGAAAIFRTANGGQTWTRTSVSTITPFVDAVWFFDANEGIFVGDPLNSRWGIGLTTDGGATWNPLNIPLNAASSTEAGWNNSFAVYGDNVWFGTNNSRIYYSKDRGQTWNFAPTPSLNSLGISFANANDGMALFRTTQTGGTYALAVSHNGGQSWTNVALPFTGAAPASISFVPGTTRALVATQNGVYETSDYGATWKPMAMPVIDMTNVTIATARNGNGVVAGYGVNYDGILINYREVPTGVRNNPSVETEGTIISMTDNIPNPFSTETTVSFELRYDAPKVTMTVNDAAGGLVQTRDLGSLSAGEHTFKFNGSSLAAGTYFCTIEALGKRATRRMLIVR